MIECPEGNMVIDDGFPFGDEQVINFFCVGILICVIFPESFKNILMGHNF
jgi:hypothetical protein